ncbi:MAG: tetratricopeptide repeat protein [Polyangiaceae bacterium]|nr:tetratricopeptide repeat protein [Polyangiaceae bacterium]
MKTRSLRPRRTSSLAHALSSLVIAASVALVAPSAHADQAALDEAKKAIDTSEYDEALATLQKLESGSDAARAALLRAELYLRTGKLPQAQKDAERAAKDKALRPAAAALRGEILWAQGKTNDAISALREVESDPLARRARLLLGEYLIAIGKRNDARAPLMTIIDDYNSDAINAKDPEGLSYVGRAAHLLRSQKEGNEAYKEAERAGAKKRVETLLWRADLFLDKYNPGDAGGVIADAEKLAPNDPRVRVMKARFLLENAMDFSGAEAEIRRALEVNPGYADAHFVQAGLALRDLDTEAADKAVDEGLKVNPNDLELLSMKAAIRFLADDKPGFDKAEKKVLELNPTYSRLYAIITEYAEWEHRYDDIIAFNQKAISVDPKDEKAYAQLGLNLIRAGKEDEGLVALNKAWDKDPFNVRVFNTLNLYEKTIANDYTTVDGQTFRIRYLKDEKAILERYVPQLLEEAWGSMVKRYGFTPKMPVSIELYADDEHFSVRTSGLPNVGIQGVCFGQSLALLSPQAAPFNWGNVLWHELGHVFAIQLSKNHVPRWFTEGLSEYETIVRRPEWQREEDPALYAALKKGRIPALTGFNRAFTHVDSVEEVTMAYYAASQIIVFMADKYGFDKVVSMLPRWAKGERTPEVIKASLGVTPEQVDKQYRAWLDARYKRYATQYVPDLHAPALPDAEDAVKKAPNDARKQVELAIALLRAGQTKEGKAALDAALKIDPSQPDALYVLADLALDGEKGDEKAKAAEAQRLLSKLVSGKHDGYAVRMKMANIALATEDLPAAQAALSGAMQSDPSQAEPVAGLVKINRILKDERSEMDALRKYVLLEQHDRAAWERLLSMLVARNYWDEAVKIGESAVYVDVSNPEVHRLYARALANNGRLVSAIYEYNSAIVAGASPESAVEIYRELAKGYEALKQPKMAEKAREYQQKVEKRASKQKPKEESGDQPGHSH